MAIMRTSKAEVQIMGALLEALERARETLWAVTARFKALEAV